MQGNGWLFLAIALPLLGAVPAYWLGRKKPQYALTALLMISAATFMMLSVLLWQSVRGNDTEFLWNNFCVMGLSLATDGFRALYAWLAGLCWLITSVFSMDSMRNGRAVERYAAFTLATLGAVIGVFLSNQLLTTMVFFEIMSLGSYPWVIHDETPEALRAGQSYLWIAVIGGLCLMMGLMLLPQTILAAQYSDGVFPVEDVQSSRLMLSAVLMLIGFGAKAGAFPLHVWLPRAYPAAPAPATALLSAVLSKAGVFGILILSVKLMEGMTAWHTLIFWVGVVTMVIGGLLALVSIDMKRILACSSMSQIGFILVGLGAYGLLGHHGGIAAQGLVQHMVNHTLFKLILFLSAGIVFLHRGTTKLNEIAGYGRGKPLFHLLFLSGMLGIAGVPMLSGFASKSLLHEGLIELVSMQGGSAYAAAEWLFIISGGMTLAYMLKIYICLFWEGERKPVEEQTKLSKTNGWLLGLCAAAPLALGAFPSVFMNGISKLSAGIFEIEIETVQYFTMENVEGILMSLGIGLILYLVVVRGLLTKKEQAGRVYVNGKPAWMDLEDMVYRPVLQAVTTVVCFLSMLISVLPDLVVAGTRRMLIHVRAWRVPMPGGNRVTCGVGEFLNSTVSVLNKTVLKNNPTEIDFSCALAAGNEELNRQMKRLKRSVSYSLLLFCIGLFLVLSYLVFCR